MLIPHAKRYSPALVGVNSTAVVRNAEQCRVHLEVRHDHAGGALALPAIEQQSQRERPDGRPR